LIGYIEGRLLKKEPDRILVLASQVGYEILLPAFVEATYRQRVLGEAVALFIYFHQTERQPKPVLIGFNLEVEKEFFQLFISVEDIGPLKAVRALELPVREVARAIEAGDAGTLRQLKGIGARTAQKIIAALSGKTEKYALIRPAPMEQPAPLREDFTRLVHEVLVQQLGHKAADAKRMIGEALQRNAKIASPEELFEEIYRGEQLA
jgi:Holliday junction DNA helicase RuvA